MNPMTMLHEDNLQKERKVPAENFMKTIAANVDNGKLTDEQFREFVRNTLPIVKGI